MKLNYTKPEITDLGQLFTVGQPRKGYRFSEMERQKVEEYNRAREACDRNSTRLSKLKRRGVLSGFRLLYRFGGVVVWSGRFVYRIGSVITQLGLAIEEWAMQ